MSMELSIIMEFEDGSVERTIQHVPKKTCKSIKEAAQAIHEKIWPRIASQSQTDLGMGTLKKTT